VTRKKLFALLIVFCLLLNLLPVFDEISYAESEQKVVKVRVEGKTETLFDREITVTDEVYGFDLLKNAVGENNIDYTYYEAWNSYFINGVLGEEGERAQDYDTGWCYYVKTENSIQQPMVGIDKLRVEGIEELVFYIGAYNTAPPYEFLTNVPTIHVTQNGSQYELTVTKSVYNEETGNYDVVPIKDVDVNVSYIGNFKTDDDGKVSFEIGKGIYKVTISKGKAYPEIVRQHFFIYGEDSEKIIKAVEDLKRYYKKDGEYSFREAIALNHTGKNINEFGDINNRFETSATQSASAYAGNIIGLIAAGKDPQEYVNLLVASQTNEGKFIVGQWDDWPTTIAYSIIALDMAGAEYDVQKAVEALMSKATEEGHFGDVDTTAMCIMALANHKDIQGVTDLINSSLAYLKSQQLDTGGFQAWGAENPYSISAVIQALIANDINPLSQEWIKNGNTMLDALLSFKVNDHFEYTSQWGTDISMATEQAFAALADLYRGKSMYHDVRLVEIANYETLAVERIGSGIFQKGEEAHLSVKVKNNTQEGQQITLIVALFDTNENKMINYTYVTKTLGTDEEIITGGFLIPESGEYEVRAFLWDNLEDMNVLADPLVVDVE